MAVAFVTTSDDPTITGFTIISPGGETTYIDVDTARKMGSATDGEAKH